MKRLFYYPSLPVCAVVVVVVVVFFIFGGFGLLLFRPTGPVPDRASQSSPHLASLVTSLTFE